MMDGMMGGMGVWGVIGLVLLLAVIATGVYLGVHAARQRDAPDAGEDARTLLERRLAAGEIGTEEFYERESALRSSRPTGRGRQT
jgi:uncharacterized membrane protein